jgi:hypothetical protein
MNDPAAPAANAIAQPGGAIRAVQEFATQYATAILVAVIVASVVFPGNEFLPVPWQHDDYKNLSGHLSFSLRHPIDLFCARPVSTNIIWWLGAADATTYFVTMFLVMALLPVLAVRLALRLFRCRAGPWEALWLTAAVTFCTFLFEKSPWFYRYTGLMTNLTSVATGMLAAYCFCRCLDGKTFAFAVGCLLFLASAFSKEDMLLFVPLFVTADWLILRREDKSRARLQTLALVYGGTAIVIALSYCWNVWVVYAPIATGTEPVYKLSLTPSHLFSQISHYADSSRTPRVVSIALAVALGMGLLRRGCRIAAISSVLLAVTLVLPYAILPRFFEYYWLNWLSFCVAVSLVGICAAWRSILPGRFPILPWVVPVSVVVAAVLCSRLAGEARRQFTAYLNTQQAGNRYMIEQVMHRQAEFAPAETVALQGVDNICSPWLLTDGRYINAKLERQIHWLLVAKPKSHAAQLMTGALATVGDVEVISEKDLKAHPGIKVLTFDEHLNLTIRAADRR